jgi:NACalpha-BTF3-like transcription factor
MEMCKCDEKTASDALTMSNGDVNDAANNLLENLG